MSCHRTLAARCIHRIDDAADLEIRCLAGSLWVTLDHDRRDIVLEPGDSFVAHAHRRALLYALEPAAFALVPQTAAARHTGHRPTTAWMDAR